MECKGNQLNMFPSTLRSIPTHDDGSDDNNNNPLPRHSTPCIIYCSLCHSTDCSWSACTQAPPIQSRMSITIPVHGSWQINTQKWMFMANYLFHIILFNIKYVWDALEQKSIIIINKDTIDEDVNLKGINPIPHLSIFYTKNRYITRTGRFKQSLSRSDVTHSQTINYCISN